MATRHLYRMDAAWFKEQQRRTGVTSFDLGEAIGKDRTVVSKLLSGRQRFTEDHARAFAAALGVPLEDVRRHAGLAPDTAPQPGFSDGDAAPWTPKGALRQRIDQVAQALGGGRPGVDVWQVRTMVMSLQGLLAGDWLLVDTHQADRTAAGELVVAQIYDWQTGSASTVLRRHEPPVLVAASPAPEDGRVHVVDGRNVAIRGKVIATWRMG